MPGASNWQVVCFEGTAVGQALTEINRSHRVLLPSRRNESEIMKILKSNQFIKQYETITTKTTIYIVSEYIFGEDLYEYVRKKKKLTEAEAAFLMGMIIEAVIHLHNIDIIHRDLKPENIMVTFSLFRFLIKRSRGKQETSAALPLTSC